MCAIPCPIGINTGALIKECRALENSRAAKAVALRLAQPWKAVEGLSRVSLWGAHALSSVFGVKPLTALAAAARSVVSPNLIPAVPGPMPRTASGLPETDRNGAAADMPLATRPRAVVAISFPIPRGRKHGGSKHLLYLKAMNPIDVETLSQAREKAFPRTL